MKSHLFRLLKPYLDAQPTEATRIRITQCSGVEGLRELVREIEEALKVSNSSEW
jgi:tRNA-dihydrouridine synthase 1